MPCYSLAGGIDATYAVEAGATSVTINSKDPLKVRNVYRYRDDGLSLGPGGEDPGLEVRHLHAGL